MRTYDVTNFGRLNLEVVIQGKTYSDQIFTLSGVTSFSKGTQSSTQGYLKIQGSLATYNEMALAPYVDIRIVTDSGSYPFSRMYIKHPMSYDGKDINMSLDSLPKKQTYGYTDTLGNKLPYNFGHAWAKAVKITRSVAGVMLQDYHQITEYEINDLLADYNTYAQALNTLHLQNDVENEDVSGMDAVHSFREKLENLKALAPWHSDTLDGLYALLDFRLINPTIDVGVLNTWNDVAKVQALVDEPKMPKDRIRYYTSGVNTLGKIPDYLTQIATESNFQSYFSAPYIWYPVGMAAYYADFDIEITASPGTKPFISLVDIQPRYGDALQLLKDVQDIAAILTQKPESLDMDLGDYAGPVELITRGGLLKGNYADYVLNITSLSYLQAEIHFTPDPGTGRNILIDDDTFLLGKFVKIRMNTSNPFSLQSSYSVYNAKVLKQVGRTLTIDRLPFWTYATYTPPVSEVYSAEFPSQQLLKWGTISDEKFLRTGVIIGISTDLDGLTLDSDTKIPTVETYTSGFFSYSFPIVHPYTPVEPGSSILQQYLRSYAPAGGGIYTAITPLWEGFDRAYQELVQTEASVIDPVTKQATEISSIYFQGKIDHTSAVQKLGVFVGFDEGSTFSLNFNSGDPIKLSGDYLDIYIADIRPNKTVTGVKSKKGDNYVEIPSSYYTVDYNYVYEGITMTAVIFSTPLKDRPGDFSEDLIVAVDSGIYTMMNQINDLANPMSLTAITSDNYTGYLPTFTTYGFTPILETVNDLVTMCNSGYFLDHATLKVVQLLRPATPVYTLDADNIKGFIFKTTDILNILGKVTYGWFSLKSFGNTINLKLEVSPDYLNSLTVKEASIFDDKEQSLRWAKFDIHRGGRMWAEMGIDGSIDSINLEPFDILTVAVECEIFLAEVQSVDYDHMSGGVAVELMLSKCITHPGQSLWEIGRDISVTRTPLFYGNTSPSNAEFLEYYK